MPCTILQRRDGKLKLLLTKTAMERFVPACEISVSAFHGKRARECSNNFSPQRRRDWEWGWQSSVQSLNCMAVKLKRRTLKGAERAFPSLCQQAGKFQSDFSKPSGIRHRRRWVRAKKFEAIITFGEL